jgi:hypothetical protein
MAEKCDGQLKGMVQDLKEVIDYLNSTNANQQQEDNPVCSLQHSRGCGVVGVGGNPELQKMFNLPQGKFQVFKPSSK